MVVSLDPEMQAELIARAKKQIRARMKSLRSGHPGSALAERSRAIVAHLLEDPLLSRARGVASFWPMDGRGEVDLRKLDEELRKKGVDLYYPFMDPLEGGGFRTGFRHTRSATELVDRGQRFVEPLPSSRVAQKGDVDVVLVPALAADLRGHRVGYGAGYYDATLADVCPPAESIIVAYDFQLLSELPIEAHDVACTRVVTDKRTGEGRS